MSKKPRTRKVIASFKALNATGWASVDNYGVTKPITEEEARELPGTRSFDEIAEEYGLI